MRRQEHLDGRFEVLERAGAGGMGEVYKVLDRATGRTAALKLMRVTAASSEERFAREARALAELRHPAIVHYIAHGATEQGEPYLVMEWLEGEDLASLLRRRRLGVDEAISLGVRVAGALAEAHAHGTIHRDLKPANIFLEQGDTRQAKILDFGIARLQEGARMTGTGVLLGTPGYMAPEQARGDMALTPALDVFSMGSVLFEALSGRPAFEGQHAMAILAKLVFAEAPTLEPYCPDAPPALSALIARMLSKDPAARPPDGAALRGELEALAARSTARALAVTHPVGAGSLTEVERRVVSVVMIGSGEGAPGAAEAIPPDLRSAAMDMGGRIERLADGSIAVAFGGTAVIKDQVTLAARFALAARSRLGAAAIAIATGRGASQASATLGEAIERAAHRVEQQRAASATGPSPVAMDETTAALLDARFERRDSAAGPELWGERDRAESARTLLGKPTPCVGRERELRVLEEAFDTCAAEPSPQVFLVTAPAGMGKSRLVQELVSSIRRRAPEAAVWFGRAESALAGSSLHLLGGAVRAALDIRGSDTPEVRRDRLLARFASRGAEGVRLCEFLGELVGAPFPPPGGAQLAAARDDGQLMAEQMARAFEELLRSESAARPVVIILDDLHWADAASVRFVDLALRDMDEQPVFLLGLARPEVRERFPRLWASRGVQELHLRPLSRKASERLARAALGDGVPDDIVSRLVTQADGNAFYLEELIRAAAEGSRALPETVVAMVQARILGFDPEARRVLRAASVFGEVFWRGAALALLGGMGTGRTADWLSLLCDQEALVRRKESRFPGEEELCFRHALLREGAYSTLTEEDRALGHRLAGEWLLAAGESDALVLAEHFEKGELPERAAHHYLRAAERAADADDTDAISACVERGLACGATGDERAALLSLKAGICLGRGQNEDVIAHVEEALTVAPPGGKRWCMAYHHVFPAVAMSRPWAMMDFTRRFLEQPIRPEARVELIRAATWLFVILEITGATSVALALLARMRAEMSLVGEREATAWTYLRGAEANHHHIGEEAPWSCLLANTDTVRGFEQTDNWRHRCMIESYRAKALMDLGDRESAEAALRANLEMAERRGEALGLDYARVYLARSLAFTGAPEALDEAERLARGVVSSNNATLAGVAHAALARIALRRGDLATADAESLLACEQARPFPGYSWDIAALRSRVLLALGRAAEARAVSEEALALLEHLRLEGYGEIDLRLAVAETREAVGELEAARDMLRVAVKRLRLRVLDIPAGTARDRYLDEVETNARLCALAKAHLGDDALRGLGR